MLLLIEVNMVLKTSSLREPPIANKQSFCFDWQRISHTETLVKLTNTWYLTHQWLVVQYFESRAKDPAIRSALSSWSLSSLVHRCRGRWRLPILTRCTSLLSSQMRVEARLEISVSSILCDVLRKIVWVLSSAEFLEGLTINLQIRLLIGKRLASGIPFDNTTLSWATFIFFAIEGQRSKLNRCEWNLLL